MKNKNTLFHLFFFIAFLLLANIAASSITAIDYDFSTHTVIGTHSICNENGVCEYNLFETQDNCPSDCYTSVTMSPSIFLIPNQRVDVAIAFNDSRYVAGKTANSLIEIYDASFKLEKSWVESSGCLSNLNFTADANCIDCGCSKEGASYKCHSSTQSTIKATSVNGYFKLTATCNVPSDIIAGSKILQASPTFYSTPVHLKPAVRKTTALTLQSLLTLLPIFIVVVVVFLFSKRKTKKRKARRSSK